MLAVRRVNMDIDASRIPSQTIGQSDIAPGAVTYDKLSLHIQTAVATLPSGTRHVAFTTAFGTPPVITLSQAGTLTIGIGSWRADVIRVRPGSFQWYGTPAKRMRWTAQGFKA